jgi:hypothetical protein
LWKLELFEHEPNRDFVPSTNGRIAASISEEQDYAKSSMGVTLWPAGGANKSRRAFFKRFRSGLIWFIGEGSTHAY